MRINASHMKIYKAKRAKKTHPHTAILKCMDFSFDVDEFYPSGRYRRVQYIK